MSTTSFTAPNLDAEQNFASVSYKGKLSADGKSLEGTWTFGKEALPLTLTLATPETLWQLDYAGVAAMAPNADPSFDVATIKPTPPDAQMKRYGTRTRNFKAVNQTVSELICWAYHLQPRQIEGAPAWMNTEHFDLAGKPDLPGQPTDGQYKLMLRKLLAERFNLKTHMVQKTVSVYALTVDKNPPPLTKAETRLDDVRANIYIKQDKDGQLLAGANAFSMPEFADWLMNFIHDRQIVDETGLKGAFDFSLKLPAELATEKSTEDDLTNAFLDVVRQVGMKLVPKKASIDILVIDHIDKPSEN